MKYWGSFSHVLIIFMTFYISYAKAGENDTNAEDQEITKTLGSVFSFEKGGKLHYLKARAYIDKSTNEFWIHGLAGRLIVNGGTLIEAVNVDRYISWGKKWRDDKSVGCKLPNPEEDPACVKAEGSSKTPAYFNYKIPNNLVPKNCLGRLYSYASSALVGSPPRPSSTSYVSVLLPIEGCTPTLEKGAVTPDKLALNAKPAAVHHKQDFKMGDLKSTTGVKVLEDSLNIASNGHLVVTASWQMRLGPNEGGYCAVTLNSETYKAEYEIYSGKGTKQNITNTPGVVTAYYSVPPGTHTVRLICKVDVSGKIEIANKKLLSIFVPQTMSP